MKRHILSSLTAVLLAAAIALAGIAVPRLLIRQQTDRLNAKSELLSSDQLTPYAAGVDSPVRIQKLANMAAAALSNYGSAELYASIREPLDTELSQEAASLKTARFLASILDAMDAMGLSSFYGSSFDEMVAGATDAAAALPDSYYDYQAAKREALAAGLTEADLLVNYIYSTYFWASPEDSSLAMWILVCDSPVIGATVCVDAVTGIPIYLTLDAGGLRNGYDYFSPVIHAYQDQFPGRFPGFGEDVEAAAASGFPSVAAQMNGIYSAEGYSIADPEVRIAYYTTSSEEIFLEMELPTYQDTCYGMVFRLYA